MPKVNSPAVHRQFMVVDQARTPLRIDNQPHCFRRADVVTLPCILTGLFILTDCLVRTDPRASTSNSTASEAVSLEPISPKAGPSRTWSSHCEILDAALSSRERVLY